MEHIILSYIYIYDTKYTKKLLWNHSYILKGKFLICSFYSFIVMYAVKYYNCTYESKDKNTWTLREIK
jgi:hypothetical protein